MRQIFSSQRVETAEGVAKRLSDAGIEVRMSNGRSYHSKRSGQFSYLEKGNDKNLPTVWVVRADDQVRAREILREAGLLASTRRDPGQATALDYANVQIQPRASTNWGWRIRVGLLLLIAAAVLFIVLRPASPGSAPLAPTATDNPAATQPTAQPATQPEPEPGVGEDEFRVRIVPSQD